MNRLLYALFFQCAQFFLIHPAFSQMVPSQPLSVDVIEKQVQVTLREIFRQSMATWIATNECPTDLFDLDYRIPKSIEGLFEVDIDDKMPSCRVEFRGVHSPVTGKVYAIEGQGTISGMEQFKILNEGSGTVQPRNESGPSPAKADPKLALAKLVFREVQKQPLVSGAFNQSQTSMESYVPFNSKKPFIPYDKERAQLFGFRYYFQVEPLNQSSKKTLFLFEKNGKPKGSIQNLDKTSKFASSEDFFVWQTKVGSDRTKICQLHLNDLIHKCVEAMGPPSSFLSLSPSGRTVVFESKGNLVLADFLEKEVIRTSIAHFVRVKWKDETHFRVSARNYSIAEVRALRDQNLANERNCIRFIAELKKKYLKGSYAFKREFKVRKIFEGDLDQTYSKLKNEIDIFPILLYTENPLRDFTEMSLPLTSNCEHLRDANENIQLEFAAGSEEFLMAEASKLSKNNSCQKTSDCGRNIIFFGKRAFFLNRKNEEQLFSRLSKVGYSKDRLSYWTHPERLENLYCRDHQCVDSSHFKYPNGLLPGPETHLWQQSTVNFRERPVASQNLDPKRHISLFRVIFKSDARVKDVNSVLTNNKLKIFKSKREHSKIFLIVDQNMNAEYIQQVLLNLEKNPLIVAANRVRIPLDFRTCVNTGGISDGQDCRWPAADWASILPDRKNECERVGGRYVVFGSTCVDNCFDQVFPSACGAAMTGGCDCGPERCWHRGTCINNPKIGDEDFESDNSLVD